MTDNDQLDAICSDYLDRLESSLASLPPGERQQILDQVAEHISTARASLPTQTETAVREILERLGTPDEIADSAGAVGPIPSQRRDRGPVLLLVGVAAIIVVGVGLAALLGAFSAVRSIPNHFIPPATPVSGSSSTTPLGGMVTVPDVLGKQLPTASQGLASIGLGYAVTYVSSDQAVGIVVDQQPSAGARVSAASKVALTVSGAQSTSTVPNVIGLSQAQAEAELAAAGLRSRAVAKNDGSSAPGMVVDQSPTAGSTVRPASTVTLTVAS